VTLRVRVRIRVRVLGLGLGLGKITQHNKKTDKTKQDKTRQDATKQNNTKVEARVGQKARQVKTKTKRNKI
jgi:hypothetical protein